jgi:hypothetical protein
MENVDIKILSEGGMFSKAKVLITMAEAEKAVEKVEEKVEVTEEVVEEVVEEATTEEVETEDTSEEIKYGN